MEIQAISSLDYATLKNILTSNKISEARKVQFVKDNKTEISDIIRNEFNITESEFTQLMKGRPLVKFRPLKNSFTKTGDKILLAKTLGIQPNEVSGYIKNLTEDLKNTGDLKFLPKERLDAIKTYVYRHGSKDELVTFLDYELKSSKDIVKSLYSTLEYYTGGVADYFIRPIHQMDNKTLVRLYNVIDKNLQISKDSGLINQEENDKLAKWTLCKIYNIQNNNKLINAIKTYKVLK